MISLEQLQDGIVIPLDKPRQWTSFQAVNKVKAVVRNTYGLKKFKIGHAGTLDPLATGLLLVCLGKATKTIPQLQDGDKVYTGTFVLGATTPCYDLERPIDNYYPYEHITPALLDVKDMAEMGVSQAMAGISSLSLAVGFIAAFVCGCLACKWMINIVKKGKLIWFALYCAVVGLATIIIPML